MDRKEFLKMLGVTTGGALVATCMGSCKKEYQQIIPPDANFMIDLSSAENAPLKTNGGYVYINGIIIARTVNGDLIAVSQACTHLSTSVQYQAANNLFYCPNHFATFTTTGDIIQGPVNMALKQYTVTVNGNIVSIVG